MPTFKRSPLAAVLAAVLVAVLCAAAAGVGWAAKSYATAVRDASAPDDAVVVLGASVSGGHRASAGAAWPDEVAQRLRMPDMPFRMVNASISTTRLLTQSGEDSPSALSRQETDALSVPGVHTIVLTDVINDIQQTPHQYNPRTIIAGLKAFVAKAHARGVRVIGTTIPPYRGFPRYEPEGERCRQAVNEYIRHNDLFDGVLDFDGKLKDPSDPTRLRPDYDSGDHLHPNDRGHRAMADAIHLSKLTGSPHGSFRPSIRPRPGSRAHERTTYGGRQVGHVSRPDRNPAGSGTHRSLHTAPSG